MQLRNDKLMFLWTDSRTSRFVRVTGGLEMANCEQKATNRWSKIQIVKLDSHLERVCCQVIQYRRAIISALSLKMPVLCSLQYSLWRGVNFSRIVQYCGGRI